jgi:hypothetical protein
MSTARPLLLPTAFYLEGFKSFVLQPAVIPLRPLTLIFGENSSGKSSIIQGLWLAGRLLKAGRVPWNADANRICGVDLGPMENFVGSTARAKAKSSTNGMKAGFYLEFKGDLSPDWMADADREEVQMHWDRADLTNRECPTPYSMGIIPSVLEPNCHVRDGAWLFLEIEAQDEDGLCVTGISIRTPYFHVRYQGGSEAFAIDGESTNHPSDRWVEPMQDFGAGIDLPENIALKSGCLQTAPSNPESERPEAFQRWFNHLLSQFSDALAALFQDPIHIGAQRSLPRLPYHGHGQWAASRDESRLWDNLFKEAPAMRQLNGDLAAIGVPYVLKREPVIALEDLRNSVEAWFRAEPDLDQAVGDDWRESLEKMVTPYATTGIPRTYLATRAAKAAEQAKADYKQEARAEFLGNLVNACQREGILVCDTAFNTEVDLHNVGRGLLSVIYAALFANDPDGSLRALEEPELHLHPRLQVAMGDLLFRAVQASGRILLVETHSEHILLRLLHHVQETHNHEKGDRLPAGDLALVHVGREHSPWLNCDITQTRIIRVRPNGTLNTDEWPGGFFEERLSAIGVEGGRP